MLKEILKQIANRGYFVLTSHVRPDGDAVGSALACSEILRRMGKKAEVVLRDGVPRVYQRLPFAGRVMQAEAINAQYDAAILLECDSIQRTRLRGLEGRFLINIDHHRTARPFADLNWIDPRAAATGEMIYCLARAAEVKISPEIATCLYTAVLTDTGAFMFESTSEHTFELARELVLAGANPARCARQVYFGHSTAKLRLLGAALSALERDGSLAWMPITQAQMERAGAKEEDCEGLVNYALSIGDVEVAVFFRELPDGRFRVSLRSKGGLDVSEIAAEFGGGGHRCASGCAVDGPLEAATARVLGRVRCRVTPSP
ncbi:MAG: bifunctional oligoribonuclease/PAP phosphatase NrnA [Acidobacteria bacterium]|nr:bifunctional oligoribonuclease/PAP phosphatase NrnA [Acidobacteriota bacterium]MBV9623577.1 bifunctional oligoribonuclease/PAP phosphatase NrnA [Acidobacteriota bacterium]